MKKGYALMLTVSLLLCLVLLFNSCAKEEPPNTTPSGDNTTVPTTPDGNTAASTTSDDSTDEPTHTHQYENGVCKICGEIDPNAGIDYDIFNFEFLDDDTYRVHLKNGISVTEVLIPATYNGKPVTSIDEYAFEQFAVWGIPVTSWLRYSGFSLSDSRTTSVFRILG